VLALAVDIDAGGGVHRLDVDLVLALQADARMLERNRRVGEEDILRSGAADGDGVTEKFTRRRRDDRVGALAEELDFGFHLVLPAAKFFDFMDVITAARYWWRESLM